MSLGAGFRSIYDEIRNLRVKSKEGNLSNLQSMPDIHQRQHTIRRTLSKDRSSIWRDNRCCCQQRVNEIERIRRKIVDENTELRRLCIYLDDQRQQALNELSQWRSGRQMMSLYSDPCCGSNCEFRCPIDSTNAPSNQQSPELPAHQQNEELLNYIQSLENRILTLEQGKTSIHRNGILLGKTRHPIRSVSQQHSPISSTPTSTTRDFTLQANPNIKTQQHLHVLESSQSTLTDSGTTYYSSELDEDDEEEDNSHSTATTVYVAAAKRTSNAANNLSNLAKQIVQQNNTEKSRLVKKFLSTREAFVQALKKRNDLAANHDFGYAIIQRENKNAEHLWSESSDLPPPLPELIMKRKFTVDKPMNNGLQAV